MVASNVSDIAAPATEGKVRHRWRNLSTLAGVMIVDNTESGLTSTLFPSISAALRLDSGHLGALAALGKIASAPAGPLWTMLADRTSRRTALVATTISGGVFGIAAGFSQNFIQLLIFNTLMVMCVIGSTPIANAVIMDSFDDMERARATGYFYGAITGVASLLGPALALFTGTTNGWRLGMWGIGAICLLSGAVVLTLFRDPGVGASEGQANGTGGGADSPRPTVASVLGLFRIPTFSVMMASRLLSGHLLITIFGVQFLVVERGFSNSTAAVVLIPFGIGYVLSTVVSGWVMAGLDRRIPHRGRVWFIQFAQIFFGAAAFFGTQIDYGHTIAVYGIFWALMGVGQGMNPCVNRPIVAAVITPELRGQGFAVFLTVFETLGWAIFSLGAGRLADSVGIQEVFLWILVVLMVVNAAVLGLLHLVYPRDVRRVTEELERRRAAGMVG